MPRSGTDEQRRSRNHVPGTCADLERNSLYGRNTARPRRVPPTARALDLNATGLEDRDDLLRARIDDDDLVTDQDVVVAAPFGIDHDHFRRQRVETHAVGDAGSHPHRYVQTRRFHLLLLDDGGDLAALLGAQLDRTRGRSLAGGAAVLFGGGLACLAASGTRGGTLLGLGLHIAA